MKLKRVISILVVDNYPVVQLGLRTMLKARDLRVVGAARTGDEALRLLAARTPDIAVVKLRSDEPEGLDLIARMKKRRPKTSVVIVTRSRGTQYLARAIALGCSGYLDLSTAPGELKRAIRAIAGGECVINPDLLRELLRNMAPEKPGRGRGLMEQLTAPEREVLHLITEGKTNRQIAAHLRYSLGAVKDCVQKIIEKLGVSDRTQAAVKAVHFGLIE
jgi:DNA-binding NarL/FixJ family response regulator